MQAVDELLQALRASPVQAVPLPAWHYQEAGHTEARPQTVPLREALSKCYDLR